MARSGVQCLTETARDAINLSLIDRAGASNSYGEITLAIYGTALLSLCLIIGLVLGKCLGMAIGVEANVGGVGIAMLLLILISGRLQDRGRLAKPTQSGVVFWSLIYIPVVVAMAACQNVRGAIDGGVVAIVAGTLGVLVSFMLVPLISRLAGEMEPLDDASSSGGES